MSNRDCEHCSRPLVYERYHDECCAWTCLNSLCPKRGQYILFPPEDINVLNFHDNNSWARVHSYKRGEIGEDFPDAHVTLELSDGSGPGGGSLTVALSPQEAKDLAMLLYSKASEVG